MEEVRECLTDAMHNLPNKGFRDIVQLSWEYRKQGEIERRNSNSRKKEKYVQNLNGKKSGKIT